MNERKRGVAKVPLSYDDSKIADASVPSKLSIESSHEKLSSYVKRVADLERTKDLLSLEVSKLKKSLEVEKQKVASAEKKESKHDSQAAVASALESLSSAMQSWKSDSESYRAELLNTAFAIVASLLQTDEVKSVLIKELISVLVERDKNIRSIKVGSAVFAMLTENTDISNASIVLDATLAEDQIVGATDTAEYSYELVQQLQSMYESLASGLSDDQCN